MEAETPCPPPPPASPGHAPAWAERLTRGRDPVDAWPPPRRRDGWHHARVVEIIPETPDAVTLRVARSDARPFLPGQHFNVELPAGGAYPSVEAYSAASSPFPHPGIVDLTVKEVPGGRVSPVLVRRVPVGATLAIEGPLGYFTWNEADGGPLALVGAGSGIVPLMSMIRYTAARDLRVPIRLLYSSRDLAHTVYRRELDSLHRHHRWLEVVHALTGDPAGPGARYHRRVDHDMLADVYGDIAGRCLAYVCGPFDLVTRVEASLRAIGVGPGRIMSENWQ